VALEGLTSVHELSTIKFKTCVNVCLDVLVLPGNNWTNGSILQVSLGRLLSHLIVEIGLSPVLVNEKN